MARSILGTLGLALTLAFALPVAYAGVSLLLDGRTTWGAVLLGVAVLMVVVEQYVTTPMDVPGEIAGTVLGRVVKEPDESGEGDARPETGGEAGGDATDAARTEDEDVLIPDAESDDPR